MAKNSEKADAAYAEALKRIEACRNQQLRRLDLRTVLGLGLTTLPPEIFRLTALTALDLTGNQLTTLPPEIGQLTTLKDLYLNGNQLRTLPPEIGQLKALKELNLSGNKFTTLPPVIGQLTALTVLNLTNNHFSTLPSEIGQLTALTVLNLSNNQFTKLPSEIGQLTALKQLWLQFNQLRTLPPEVGKLAALSILILDNNRLTALPSEIGKLTALTDLYLTSNKLTTLPGWLSNLTKLERLFLHDNPALHLSPFVLGHDPRDSEAKGSDVSAKSILDFYFGRQSGKTRPLNEVKLILVGRGGAGKTCTVRALRDLPFRDKEQSTPGIALCDWTMDGCKGEPVTAHVWDFAGQVITHALHQFFFSVRSVYVVVLTGRENHEREDAEYWLRLIKAFGTDDDDQGPPVIVALNKWDVPGCRPRVDRGALQERYPFIRRFVEVDCQSNKGIPDLKAALCQEVDGLKWVRDPFPETWDAVRRALTKGENTEAHRTLWDIVRRAPTKGENPRAHLTFAEYRQLCVEHGVTDEGQQESLSEILHNLGAALNYRTDPRLREATVLQPEWLTSNVYALMRRAETHEGVLTQADIDDVLSSETNAAMRAYLVQIMERFEIAYTRTSSAGVWLVPQALPDNQPDGVAAFRDAAEATRSRYIYPALPEGLVARAIVRLHEFIEEVNGKKQQWASGAILAREGARALIRTEPQDQQVMITVTGHPKARQQLAGLCQAEMRDIHSEIPGLDPTEETQVQGAWVATKTLEADEKQGRATGISTDRGTVDVDPAGPNNAYSVKPARSEDLWKPTVFISYSKSNVNQRKRLESELKILKNEGLLASHWHDRMIDPGDKWDDTIQSKLAEVDVVIILVSVAALATDYITEHEIPKALELHNAGQTVVVPVILEACHWESTLGRLCALPEKARPLTAFNPRSNGWKTIADGLMTVFQKLMQNGGNKKKQSAARPSKKIE